MALSSPDPAVPALILIGGDGGYSGVPTYIGQMLRALQGHARITVLSDVNQGGYDDIAVHGARHITVAGLRTHANPLHWPRTAHMLMEQIAAAPGAVIWPQARMGVLLVRMLLARGMLDQPVAVTYHGLTFDPGHRRVPAHLALHFERAMLRRSPPHDLVFLSEAAQNHFRTVVGPQICDRHRFSVLGNASDLGPLPKLQSAGSTRTLVMTGRAGHQKNIPAAARIFAHLPDHYRLILCGTGTDSRGLRRQLARLLRSDVLARVTFRGPVADVRAILGAADGYLMTSRYEGMPIGALEAFEAGLPLALSAIPGTAEIREAHPLCLSLSLSNPAADAASLDTLITNYLAARPTHTAEIQAKWSAQFSFSAWAPALRSLWDQIRMFPP